MTEGACNTGSSWRVHHIDFSFYYECVESKTNNSSVIFLFGLRGLKFSQ